MATPLEQEIYARLSEGAGPMALATAVAVRGSTPCKPGFKLLVYPDGSTLGSAGGGKLEQLVIADAQAAIADGKPVQKTYELTEDATGMWCGGEATIYIEPYLPPTRLWVFGYGHLAREVQSLATRAGFAVQIVHQEDVAGANIWRFDWAQLSPWPGIGAGDYVLLLTMDAERELRLAAKLAQAPPRYLGIAGSRTKAARLKQELAAQGVAAEQLHLHLPVGMEIHARTAAEISVSIVSELIKERNAD